MKLEHYSVLDLLRLLQNKKISAKETYDYFYIRSKKYNAMLNAYITILPDNYNQTSSLIGGLPIAIKDNFCTKKILTTASSNVLKNFYPPFESTVTKKLKTAGFSILGKTNLDAWAHGSSTDTSDFGPSKNPYNIDYSPGGSSGGSSVAVSAGLIPCSIGSETAGSIRQPSAWCGVVGLKPTYSRVSRYGVVAMGSSWDCPGTITKTVSDSAFLLSLIAGKDMYDATSSEMPVDNYLKKISIQNTFTIGIPESYFIDVNKEIIQAIEKIITLLQKSKCTIKKISLMDPKYATSVYMILQRSEVSSNLARYTGVRYGKDRTYFGSEAKRRIMLGTYALSSGYYDAYYKKAQKVRIKIIQDFENAFKTVDCILAPVTSETACKIGKSKSYSFFGEMMDKFMEPSSSAGVPGLSLPIGIDKKGLPIGMQIIGPHFKELLLLQLGYHIEKQGGLLDVNTILKKYE